MVVLASIAGGLGGLLGKSLEQTTSYFANKSLQENQAKLNYDNSVKFAQWSAENSPSMNRAGLTKAGYNPMLAVQNATSGTNAASFAGSVSSQPADYMQGVSAGVANAQSIQRLKNETAQTESTVEANKATARNQIAEAINKEIQSPFISQREQKNLSKLDAEIVKLNRETDYLSAAEENMIKMRELQEKLGIAGINAQLYSADKAYNASTYGKDDELSKIRRYNAWAEKHPYVSSLSETMERHFGSVLGATAAALGGFRFGQKKNDKLLKYDLDTIDLIRDKIDYRKLKY